MMDDFHVIPANDLREHRDSEGCWCRPVRDEAESRVVIHNSLDGRETYENGRLAQ